MKAFIDLGAWTGDTIVSFQEGVFTEPGRSDLNEFEIFAFEPDIRKRIAFNNKNVVHVYPWAASNNDGVAQYSVEEGQAGTIVERNDLWHQYMHVPVKMFDFSKWLDQNFSVNDEIIVKIDIEGSEYDILEKMIADETYKMVDMFFIEFHQRMFPGDDSPVYGEREQKIRQVIPNIKEWI